MGENEEKIGRLRSRGEMGKAIGVGYFNGLGHALNASITLAWQPASPARRDETSQTADWDWEPQGKCN